jgi:hypothetical protein
LRTSQSSEHRLRTAARLLDPEQRFAGACAIALAGSIFLPWWRDPVFHNSYVGARRISFIEIALLLVAAAVLVLLLRRAEGKAFHLPLSDSTLIAAAGVWASFLLVFRMLDPPTRTVAGETLDYGMRWGIILALAAAFALAGAGIRARRRYHRGEPEAVAADADATPTLPLHRS